jgi:shikimate 5-dehydrogenase
VLGVAGGLIDLPYADDATGTMREAARLGIPRVGGFEFLVRQAVASFALWTGCILEFEEVTAALKKP